MGGGRIRLVTRGDDSGSCHAANAAIRDAFEKGILRNTSLMVPCPAFEEAAGMFRDMPGLCVGLHATLTAEWDEVRWGPVLPPEDVPSLVDADGYLFQTTRALHENGADPGEMMAEVEAQLALARSEGLGVRYVDSHMGFTWIADMDARLARFAEREGLIYRPKDVGRLPAVEGEFDNPVDELVARLSAAPPGTYVLVGHPCYDTEEVRRFYHPGIEPGSQGPNRDWQRRMFMDPEVLECCEANGIQPIRYTEI